MANAPSLIGSHRRVVAYKPFCLAERRRCKSPVADALLSRADGICFVVRSITRDGRLPAAAIGSQVVEELLRQHVAGL